MSKTNTFDVRIKFENIKIIDQEVRGEKQLAELFEDVKEKFKGSKR